MSQKALDFMNFRFEGIGGSDAAVLMGVSPYKTEYQLWEEKVFRKSKDVDNPAMAQGRRLEEPVRVFMGKALSKMIKPASWISPEAIWFRGNVDGIDEKGTVLLEIKNPTSRENHEICLQGKVPEHYIPQIQHYLELARHVGYDLPSILYVSHLKSNPFDPEIDPKDVLTVEVFRDEPYITELLSREKIFWDRVINWNPPALTEMDRLLMKEVCQTPAERLRAVLETLEKLEEEKDKLKDHLIELNDGQSSVGFGISLVKSVSRGSIDWAKVAKANPELETETFRKAPLTKWTVRRI